MHRKTQITISLDGKGNRVSISSFVTVLSQSVGLLKSISRQMEDDQSSPVIWNIVAASMESPLELTLAPSSKKKPNLGRRVIREYIYSIRAIEESADLTSTKFSARDLENAKKMVGVLNDGVRFIKFSSPEFGEARATQHLAANVDELQSKLYRYEVSSFRGRLENIATHANENSFTIFDLLTDGPIICEFPEDRIGEIGPLLRKRVYVYGRTKFDRNDNAISIVVSDFRALKDSAELPKISEAKPIDITGDLDSVEYVRRIRNGENG